MGERSGGAFPSRTMSPRRKAGSAALLAAGLGGLLAFLLVRPPWAERMRTPAPAASLPVVSASPPAPALRLRGTSLVLRHRGVKQAEVRADAVEVSRDLRYARFTGAARLTLFDRGAVALRAAADEVVLDRQTNDLTARGNLVITAPSGYRLSAPKAIWSQATQQLTLPAGIEMRTPDAELRADRLVIAVREMTFLLAGAVDITFQVPAGVP